ncbi:MAG: DUF418 domain-containing protein [Alkaliphilus sp.]
MNQTHASPILGKQRIEIIDIIRGFALLGVLIANMPIFNSLALLFSKSPLEYGSLAARWHAWELTLLVHGRFFVIFSFLFGLGFYIFMNRVESKGLKVASLFNRRMLGLLIIGFLHLVFVWSGDILFAYSIAGFFLLLFRKKAPNSILKWIVILLILAILAMTFMHSINFLVEAMIGEEEVSKSLLVIHDEMASVLPSGTYFHILSARLRHEVASILLFGVPSVVLIVLPLFLMGFYVGKQRYFERVDELLPSFKKLWRLSLMLGVVISVPLVFLEIITYSSSSFLPVVALEIVKYLSGIIIGAFYVTSLVLLFKNNRFKKLLSYFGYVGRMALTNYLMQSFICVFIFYGFGLGFFGRISLLWGTFLSLGIFMLQMYASKLWLNHYKYGPFEWVWRKFTYKHKLLLKNR